MNKSDEKKVHVNLHFIKFDITFKQFLAFIALITLSMWIIFDLTFEVNFGKFSIEAKPVKIKTDTIQINSQRSADKPKGN